MKESDGLDEFDEQIAALEESMGGAQSMTAAFSQELQRMRSNLSDTNQDVKTLSTGISRGLKSAFDGLVFDGMKLSDVLGTIGRSMANTAYNAAVKPVARELGGMLASGVAGLFSGARPFANGASFSQGRVMPFASGGVVNGPTYFPMRGGAGLMGEAGPEAILPLSRGSDGRLGVRTQGGGRSVNVVMNITTPDVQGFRRSESQIAAQMARALARGERNR
jgi:lambda family phage tail tape measure protein